MKKHRPYVVLTVVACLSFLWSVGRNLGQQLPATIMQNADDITAWQTMVFVLEDKTLTKFDAELEKVKSVQLPMAPTPMPPQPVPDMTARPYREQSAMSPQAVADAQLTGRVCADGQHIYVLYEGVIFVFDHDLNFEKSKALEYGT